MFRSIIPWMGFAIAITNEQQIAVEIKSFIAPSAVYEFHTALGQYLNYRVALKLKEPERVLYLGVSLEVCESFFGRQLPQLSLKEYQINVVVFDPEDEVIVQSYQSDYMRRLSEFAVS